MRISLYVWVERDTKNIRYIGVTRNPLSQRMASHRFDARIGKKNHRCNYLRKLWSDGRNVDVIEVASFDNVQNAYEAEVWWIKLHRAMGSDLVNQKDGGEDIGDHSKESTERGAVKRRGQKRSDATKLLISRNQKGRVLSRERRNKSRSVCTDEMEKCIVSRYLAPEPMSGIASDLGVSECYVRAALVRNGVQIRSKSDALRMAFNTEDYLKKATASMNARVASMDEQSRKKAFGWRRLTPEKEAKILEIWDASPGLSFREIGRRVSAVHRAVKTVLIRNDRILSAV